MRKVKGNGGFPVEIIGRAIVNSRAGKWMGSKVRTTIEQTRPRRLRIICVVLMVAMLSGDMYILLRSGNMTTAMPAYSGIRPVRTAGASPPRTSKAFGIVWDKMMADSSIKSCWDSLVRVRPGLKDTVRRLTKMDSAARTR